MITRVQNARGEVVHDCLEIGCQVSWDGYAIVDVPDVPNPDARAAAAVPAVTIPAGQALPGRKNPGAQWKTVDKSTVRLIPPDLPA